MKMLSFLSYNSSTSPIFEEEKESSFNQKSIFPLVSKPSNYPEELDNSNIKNNSNNNYSKKWKTEICHYWEIYGNCKFGDNCSFAHGENELKKRKITINYKTKPCKHFFEIGYCPYGSRCQFSHKIESIQNQSRISNNNINTNNQTNINDNNNFSYLKILSEFLSSKNDGISHELIKRPRLLTFEKITASTLKESENSKLQLYKDIIDIKNHNQNQKNNSEEFKICDDLFNNQNYFEKGEFLGF